MGYLYVLTTIICIGCGQLVIKWRLSQFPPLPDKIVEKAVYLLGSLCDPYVLGGFFGAFIGSLCWIAAMTQLNISQAYPVLVCCLLLVVTLGGTVLFKEPFSHYQMLGVALIVVGLLLFIVK